jgi:tetratricopeptide (TPR) repeat protein
MPAVQRLAVLRFENLTGDDSLNWMGRAVSEVLSAELAGSRTISVISFAALHSSDRALGPRPLAAPGISTEQPAALLYGANRVLYGRISRTAGKLRLDATVFDPSRSTVERTLNAAGSEPEGIIRLADSLAGKLATPLRPFETQNSEALLEYCTGLESAGPAEAAAAFSRAVNADPNFGQALATWARLASARGDKPEAERILALASAKGRSISEFERARLAAIAAELGGDTALHTRALESLARLNPADMSLLRELAQVHLNARQYDAAAADLTQALALQPDDPALLNQLGYTYMYAGKPAVAIQALGEYRKLRPADPNALDSLGDMNFYFGGFAEAEQYYRQAFEKDHNFNSGGELRKAAQARLMTGDMSGADTIFNQYLEARRNAKDPLTEYRRAEWEFLSGRRRQAIARLDAFAQGLPAGLAPLLAPQANTQLALWELELGDRPRSREYASRAVAPHGPPVVARFLTEPVAPPSEWNARAQKLWPGPAQEKTRNMMLGYALLLQREFQAAAPVLSDLYQHSAPDPQEILPVLVAWAQVETGHFEEAARFLQRNPVPNITLEMSTSLAFPRLLFLRATALDQQGRRDDTLVPYRLFLALSGPDAQAFGEEARAHRALGN